jgi:hypothetical protein
VRAAVPGAALAEELPARERGTGDEILELSEHRALEPAIQVRADEADQHFAPGRVEHLVAVKPRRHQLVGERLDQGVHDVDVRLAEAVAGHHGPEKHALRGQL